MMTDESDQRKLISPIDYRYNEKQPRFKERDFFYGLNFLLGKPGSLPGAGWLRPWSTYVPAAHKSTSIIYS